MFHIVILNTVFHQNDLPAYIILTLRSKTTVGHINTRFNLRLAVVQQSQFLILNTDIILPLQSDNYIYSPLVFVLNDNSINTISNKYQWFDNSPIIGISFYISDLICGRLTSSFSEWKKLEEAHISSCSSVSNKISNSMIRVAATRIFADPTQSILEIPVNSIDSYRSLKSEGARSVGKFGMGFFSILYWILTSRDMVVCIDSRPRQGIRWTLLIKNINNNLLATFVDQSYVLKWVPSIDSGYGTTIYLCKNSYSGPAFVKNDETAVLLSNLEVVNDMNNQLQKLQYITDVDILVKSNFDNKQINYSNSINNRDQINISWINRQNFYTGIILKDNASGIGIDTLFSSLLIPTISTKSLESSYNCRLKDDTYKVQVYSNTNNENNNNLHISVGLIVVVNIKLQSNDNLIYHIDLPIWSKLPVSRDDVVVEENSTESEFIYSAFKEMIDISIEANYDLQNILYLLDKYSEYSSQPTIYRIVQDVYKYIMEIPNIIYLPNKLITDLLRKNVNTSKRFSYLRKISISETINQLVDVFSTSNNIIVDYSFNEVRIVVLSGFTLQPTNAGLPSLIFMSPEMYERSNWKEALITSYSSMILTLKSSGSDKSVAGQTIKTKWKLETDNSTHDGSVGLSNGSKKMEFRYGYMKIFTIFLSMAQDDDYELFYLVYQPCIYKLLRYTTCKSDYSEQIAINRTRIEISILHLVDFLSEIWLLSKFSDLSSKVILEVFYQISNIINTIRVISEEGKAVGLRIRPAVWQSNYKIERLSSSDFVKLFSPDIIYKMIQGYLDYQNSQLDADGYMYDKNSFRITDYRYDLFIALCLLDVEIKIHQNTENLSLVRDIGNNIISRSISVIQMYSILTLITRSINNIHQYLIENPVYEILDYIVFEVSWQYDFEFFEGWSKDDPESVDYTAKYDMYFYNPMIERILLYTSNVIQKIPLCQRLINPTTKYTITANNLISYVFQTKTEEIINDPNHQMLHQMLCTANNFVSASELKFQSVDIAVNQGTSKSFVTSVLTELLQNSIDAIRSNISTTQKQIDVKLCIEDNSSIILSITDYVGIPDSSILSLLIPFLSGKTTDDMMSTGEMGTGFFNVYRQPYCSYVTIQTNDIYIKAKPVINNSRVIDIKYKFSFEVTKIKGTIISIIFNKLNKQQTIDLIVDIRLNSITLGRLSVIPVYVQNILQTLTKILIYEDDVLSTYITEENIKSYILTNGVPFIPLMDFANNNIKGFKEANNYALSMNVIIDLKKGKYIPTQSRHRMQSISGNIGSIIKGLWYALTYKLTQPDSENILILYYNQITASTSIDQLHNYSASGSKIFIKNGIYQCHGQYKLLSMDEKLDNFDISYIINNIIKNFNNLDLTEENVDLLFDNTLKYSNDPTINHNLIRKLIRIFFRDKTKKGSRQKILKPINYNVVADTTNVKIILNTFVQIYYEIGQKILIPGISFPSQIPTVDIIEMDEGVLGYYSYTKRSIFMNIYTISKIVDSLDVSWKYLIGLYNKDISMFTKHLYLSPWAELIGNTFPMSTLIHEMQHNILHTDHTDKEAHPILEINDHKYSYNEGCQYVYEHILSSGFWIKFMTKLRK